jgi:enoyl-CoA hydratase/carnithine racemase
MKNVINIFVSEFQVNSLNEEVMSEMQTLFKEIQGRSDVRAAVLMSGKPGCFIAGADIKMLERCLVIVVVL